MPADPLKDLARLGEDALGPCAVCDRVMLATNMPLFLRFKVQRCGIDAASVSRHVGLAQMMGGGRDGLALASIMGPGEKPVVILNDWKEVNVCTECAGKTTVDSMVWNIMAREPDADEVEQSNVAR